MEDSSDEDRDNAEGQVPKFVPFEPGPLPDVEARVRKLCGELGIEPTSAEAREIQRQLLSGADIHVVLRRKHEQQAEDAT